MDPCKGILYQMSPQQNIIDRLKQAFNPSFLELKDESLHHSKHPQSKGHGGGHYQLIIVSEHFKNISLIERHRMIYSVLKDEMISNIHALSIKAFLPDEFNNH